MNIQCLNGMAYVSIQPIQAKFTDTSNCTMLFIRGTDNFIDSASLYWELRSDDNQVHMRSSEYSIVGDAYMNWVGNNDYPFTFIANILGLTIL